MTKIKHYLFFFMGINFLSVHNAYSDQIKLPPRENYSGARAHGMGNAFTGVADDESAIFANPAGIGQEDGKATKNFLRGASFPNLSVAGNRTPGAVQKAYVRTEGSGVDKLSNALSALAEHDATYGRVSLFPYLTLGRMQLGLIADEEMLVYKNKFATPQTSGLDPTQTYQESLHIYSRSQLGGVIGVSLPHKSLGLSLGVSARYVTRTTLLGDYEIGENLTPLSAEKLSQSLNRTTGIGVDMGLLYTPQKNKWNPTFGLVLKDVGNTVYKAKSTSGQSEVELMNIAVGASVRPPISKRMGLLFSSEFERLNDERLQWSDKIKVGAEWGFGATDSTAPYSVRVGWNARSLSYGVTADLFLFKVDLGRYGELIHIQDSVKVDERTILRLSIDLRS